MRRTFAPTTPVQSSVSSFLVGQDEPDLSRRDPPKNEPNELPAVPERQSTIPTPDYPHPLNNARTIRAARRRASRRDVLTGPLGAAGVLGGLQMLNATEARADQLPPPAGQIDASLLNALQFARKNSADPGVAFSPDSGLLVGFGSNLFHYDTLSKTCSLFVDRQQVFTSSFTCNVPTNIASLTIGTSGTAT